MAGEQRNVVALNVGGKLFSTTLNTLSQVGYFANLFSGQWVESRTEPVFIDRDGDCFRYILSYLRDNDRAVLPREEKDLRCLQNEAHYFDLPDLEALVEARLGQAIAPTTEWVRVQYSPRHAWTEFPRSLLERVASSHLYRQVLSQHAKQRTCCFDSPITRFSRDFEFGEPADHVINYVRLGEVYFRTLKRNAVTKQQVCDQAVYWGVPQLLEFYEKYANNNF